MTEAPSDRCGHERAKPLPRANCCYRRTWEDRDRCIWHAEVSEDVEKPAEELRITRETRKNCRLNQGEEKRRVSELLDDVQLRGVQLWGVGSFADCSFWRPDLSGADLRGVDLSNAVLWHPDLIGADLLHADLTGAGLSNADLMGARLDFANLTGVGLYGADLTGAYLRDANLTDANLSMADLVGARLSDANLTNADLWRADLGWADCSDATFETADLSNASLLVTNLERANFTRTDLSGATLHSTRLFDTRLLDVAINDRTTFSDVCFYERVADPIDALHTDQHHIIPHKAGYIDIPNDEIVQERLSQYIELGARTAIILDRHVKREEQKGVLTRVKSVHQELARFRRHRQLSSNRIHEAIEYSDQAISVYRERQRLYRENSLPEEVPLPYVREKHVRRRRAFIRENWTDWLKYSLSRWIMLYGESPWRVVYSSLALVGAFGVLFPFFGGVTVETTGDAQAFFTPVFYQGLVPAVVEVLFTNLYFSAVTFTTLGYGGMQPAQPATQFLASVESLLGGVMIALLVTVLGRRVMR